MKKEANNVQIIADGVYTMKEAAEILNVGRTTFWKILKSGELDYFCYPNRKRKYFKGEDLTRFINIQTLEQDGE